MVLDKLDIYDFATDIGNEAAFFLEKLAYRADTQKVRKFINRLEMVEKENTAQIVRKRIKETGKRARKKAKNPLSGMIEKYRVKNGHHYDINHKVDLLETWKIYQKLLKMRIMVYFGLINKINDLDTRDVLIYLYEHERKRLETEPPEEIRGISPKKTP